MSIFFKFCKFKIYWFWFVYIKEDNVKGIIYLRYCEWLLNKRLKILYFISICIL